MRDAYGDLIFTKMPQPVKDPEVSIRRVLENQIPVMQQQREWFRSTQVRAAVPESLQKLKKRFR